MKLISAFIFVMLVFSLTACKENSTTPPVDDLTKGPATPKNLVLTVTAPKITISWDTSANTSRYNLYYTDKTPFKKETATKIVGAESPYIIYNLAYEKTYYFAVTAENGKGESALSEIKSLKMNSPVVGKWFGKSVTLADVYYELDVTLGYANGRVNGSGTLTGYVIGNKSSIPVTVDGTFNSPSLSITLNNNSNTTYIGELHVTGRKFIGNLVMSTMPFSLDLEKIQ